MRKIVGLLLWTLLMTTPAWAQTEPGAKGEFQAFTLGDIVVSADAETRPDGPT